MSERIRQAFIGAGANLGDRCASLRGAQERLRANMAIKTLETSSVYETEPVGLVDQPIFLNVVFGIETTFEPEALLAELLECEQHFGRTRALRWGPRTLDLDLLTVEDEMRNGEQLQLPHPRMLERAFVIVPLRELLARPRFKRACWDELRRTVTNIQMPASGIRVYPGCALA